MSDEPIVIGPEQLRDQKKRMVEEWGVDEETAEEAFTNVKTNISLQAQELGKDWNDETLNEITNLVIAIQQQSQQIMSRRKGHFYDRIYNLLAGAFLSGIAGMMGILFYMGNYSGGAVAAFILVTIIYMHTRHA